MTEPLFLAVLPDDQTCSLLAQMLAPFGSSDRLPGKLSSPEKWHVTVRFLGSLEDFTFDRLLHQLDQTVWPEPFKVTLTGFGAFPHADKASVLWVGVDSEPLFDLESTVSEVADSVGVEPDDRPYRPHLTLSRIRPPLDVSDLVADDWGRLSFTAGELILFESRHNGDSTYTPIERFGFR